MLDRALAAYLISVGVGVWTWTKNGDCVVAPADDLSVKTYPNVTILSQSSEHTPMQSGIEDFHVNVTMKFSVAGYPQSVNPYASRVGRDAIIGLVMAAMLQSSDGATLDYTAQEITAAGRALATQGSAQQQANNQDMLQFTALHVYYSGTLARGQPDEKGCDWVEMRGFRISVAPTAIDMS